MENTHRVEVRRFEPSDVQRIERLNARLAQRALPHTVFPEGAEQASHTQISERLLVAAEGDEVRGAVWLKEHPVRVLGQTRRMGWAKYLVAESLIDSRYSGVPRSLLRGCLRSQPYLLGLGFGGHHSPMARLLQVHRWPGQTVPFFFRLFRPGRALQELELAQRTSPRRIAARFLSLTGLAQLGGVALSSLSRRLPAGVTISVEPDFGDWADEMWSRCQDSAVVQTVRDAAMLAEMYPAGASDMMRLRVQRDGADCGWAVVLKHDFGIGRASPTFGRLVVGLLADVLSPPEHAEIVAIAAIEWLEAAGCDLAFTNQSHPVWIRAVRSAGLLEGPVNFAFYMSPAVSGLVPDADGLANGLHMTRGDGDGPRWYHLES